MTIFNLKDPSELDNDAIKAGWDKMNTEQRFVMFATAVTELVDAVNSLSDRQKQLEDTIAALLIREMK